MKFKNNLTSKQMLFASCFVVIFTFFLPSHLFADDLSEIKKCGECHSFQNINMTFKSGEVVSVYVNQDEFSKSVHGQNGISCSDCHKDTKEYPHPDRGVENYRDYSLTLYKVCTECHTEQLKEIEDNVHMVALDAGNPAAAICTDCHGNHATKPVSESMTHMNQTCGKCHGEINRLYEESVHGAALIGEGNPDVPSCTDCHGAHHITGPSNSPFHLFSPQVCGECHANKEMMQKYGINPNVMDSYVSDFHGKTVVIFESIAKDQKTNKPVCVDCHGVHDILPHTDENSTVMKENLLETCRRCHPNASANFPDAWLSHYSPGLEKYKPVYYIKVLYWVIIPLFAGCSLTYVISDYIRQRRNIRGGK